MSTNQTAIKIVRKAPGFYESTDGRFQIIHIVEPDQGNGYGRTDHWVVVDGRDAWDPFFTLADAKAAITEANR